MANSSQQKLKLLYLQKILLEKTDENHGMTIAELIEALKKYGVTAERKSIYSDLQAIEIAGLDICTQKTSTTRYFVGNRNFETAELKMLVDAVQSAKFITPKKSLSLIKKLEGLVSEHEAKMLHREVCISKGSKSPNEKIYYIVDALHNAIAANLKISFRYYQWDLDFSSRKKITERERREIPYVVSPWALKWDDEKYYLIGYDSNAEMIKHYRIDKMAEIEICNSKREGYDEFKKLNIEKYSDEIFSMFGGERTNVTLSVDNSLIGVITDRFGSDLFIIKESEHRFRVSVSVALSTQFYAWIFGLGSKIKILAPTKAVNGFSEMLCDTLKEYKNV